MNIEKTKLFYEQDASSHLCKCEYCQNYFKEVRKTYPKVAEYLDSIGVDISKSFETAPMDPDENGFIDYLLAQYIVLGDSKDFKETIISDVNDVKISIANSHPGTNLDEPHFVIEIYPITLKWTM